MWRASATLLARRAERELLLHRRIVGVTGEAAQRLGVVERLLADASAVMIWVEPRIALDQPAAEGDAVGLVDDAAGIDGVEVAEHRLAHQVGVQGRDAVDLVRADEGQVAHAHAPPGVLVDQRDRRQQAGIAEAALARAVEMHGVDQIDDLHVARQQPLHQRHRPALQRLGQQRVVGVGEDRLRDLPGLVPIEPVEIDQDAHQLGDGDRGMRVVELDRHVVAQRADVADAA